jgi:hypothetical protein
MTMAFFSSAGLLIAIMGSLPLWVGLLLFAEWAV